MNERAIFLHEELADVWESKYQSESFRSREGAIHSLLSNIDIHSQLWLDAGCGTGRFARLLSSAGASVVAVDGAPKMISISEELSNDASIRYLNSDLDHWSWDGENFDGVLCSSVLEYMANPRDLLLHFNELLRDGGFLIISVPNKLSILRQMQKSLFHLNGIVSKSPWPEYLASSKHQFSKRSIRSLLNLAGFSVEECIFFGSPYRLLGTMRFVSPLIFVLARKSSNAVFRRKRKPR